MGWLTRFRPGGRDREIADEIAAHLERAVQDRIERGEPPDAARLAALREFGNVPLIADTTRRVWTSTTIEQLVQDLRFGVRILRNAPGLSATAILLVALVIGGNTTIYAMVRSILSSPAAGVRTERLVAIKRLEPGATIADPFFSYPAFRDFAAQTRTLAGLTAWTGERLVVGVDSSNYALHGALVTTDYFDLLGVGVSAGRGLQAADDTMQNGLVAIISDRLWRERRGFLPCSAS